MAKFGDRVKIVAGKYKDLVGILKRSVSNEETVELELELNGSTVKIPMSYLRKYKNSGEEKDEGKPSKQSKKISEERLDKAAKKTKKAKKNEEKALTWLTPGIRVKIVSRKYRDGKYYLASGTISDILSPKDFLLVTDNKEFLEDLKEKYLETEMPKLGGAVKVLRGEHKHKVGVLHNRDKKNNRVDILLDEEKRIVSMSQDDCSMIQF
jgi:G patch domain/KOW motif-containing protein